MLKPANSRLRPSSKTRSGTVLEPPLREMYRHGACPPSQAGRAVMANGEAGETIYTTTRPVKARTLMSSTPVSTKSTGNFTIRLTTYTTYMLGIPSKTPTCTVTAPMLQELSQAETSESPRRQKSSPSKFLPTRRIRMATHRLPNAPPLRVIYGP